MSGNVKVLALQFLVESHLNNGHTITYERYGTLIPLVQQSRHRKDTLDNPESLDSVQPRRLHMSTVIFQKG